MSISRKYQYQKLGPGAATIPFQQVDALDVDEDTRVVYFGERGAFSEQAMLEYFGDRITAFNKTTFRDVIETVANGEAMIRFRSPSYFLHSFKISSFVYIAAASLASFRIPAS